MPDDRFKPSLGRIRQSKGPSQKKLIGQIQRSAQLAGGSIKSRTSQLKSGVRGRGGGARFAHGFIRHRTRRAIVKTRLVRQPSNASKAAKLGALKAHISYLTRNASRDRAEWEREDNQIEGSLSLSPEIDGELYTKAGSEIDRRDFQKLVADDRHYFRIIISPEDGHQLSSLTDYTRDLMAGVEYDLGSELNWIGVNHFDTEHPHTHIVIRGKDDMGKDLVIDRDYIARGFRERASEHLSLELGPKPDRDIAASLKQQVSQERFTQLDRQLVDIADEGVVSFAPSHSSYDRFKSGLLRGRIKFLGGLGLASEPKAGLGKWQLDPNIETVLRGLGERGDIIRSMQREMTNTRGLQIFDSANTMGPILGELISVGLSDEIQDHHFVVVDGIDGHQWYANIGDSWQGEFPKRGAIVEISSGQVPIKASDQVIDQIAKVHDGIYSEVLHIGQEGPQSEAFLLAHKRRLEALRRLNVVEREQDGSWAVPSDFLDKVRRTERSLPRLEVKSWLGLDVVTQSPSVTGLDQYLDDRELVISARGFGANFSKALLARQKFLLAQGLSRQPDLEKATKTGVAETGMALAGPRQKTFLAIQEARQFSGTYQHSVDLPSGRYAVLENDTKLTLAPWKPVLEKSRGLTVTARLSGKAVQWQLTKQLNLPRR